MLGRERGGFAICSSIALWMGSPSTLKSASARVEGNVRRNADRVSRSFPSSLQRGLKQVIIGHHDAMLITYRRQCTLCKTANLQVYFSGVLT